MSLEESSLKLLTVDGSKYILKNDGDLYESDLNDLTFCVCVDLLDFEGNEIYFHLKVQYCENEVIVSTDNFSYFLEDISVDEDVLNPFIRKVLNQSFFLDILQKVSKKSLTHRNKVNEMIELIQTESDRVRISEEEKEMINKVRLLKLTGLEE